MRFSPTTILGYVQVAATAAIIGKPLYNYWTIETYDAVTGLVVATALSVSVNSLIVAVKGHFTQDAVAPKGDATVPANAIKPE